MDELHLQRMALLFSLFGLIFLHLYFLGAPLSDQDAFVMEGIVMSAQHTSGGTKLLLEVCSDRALYLPVAIAENISVGDALQVIGKDIGSCQESFILVSEAVQLRKGYKS